MRMRIGIKANVKKGVKVWITTDGTVCNCAIAANNRQKKLNTTKTHGKLGKSYYGKGGNVGASPEKRRAMKAFVIKHNISTGIGGNGTVISMNRLLWALSKNKKAVKEFAELFAIL